MFSLDDSPAHRWRRGLPLDPELTGQLAPEDLRLPLPPVLTPVLSSVSPAEPPPQLPNAC